MNKYQKYLSTSLFGIVALLGVTSPSWAQVNLGKAAVFAVLGGSAITCTTGSVVTGNVGISPGTAAAFTDTGCTFTGTVPPVTSPTKSANARTDFLTAYAAIKALTPCDETLTGTLAGITLTPGVYCFDAAATLTGTLTLDAQGDENAEWIFNIGAALTGTSFTVVMENGGQPCNVYWAPSAAATFTTSALKGNILAGGPTGSITLTGGSLAGRILAKVAVTVTGTSIVGCKGDDLVCN